MNPKLQPQTLSPNTQTLSLKPYDALKNRSVEVRSAMRQQQRRHGVLLGCQGDGHGREPRNQGICRTCQKAHFRFFFFLKLLFPSATGPLQAKDPEVRRGDKISPHPQNGLCPYRTSQHSPCKISQLYSADWPGSPRCPLRSLAAPVWTLSPVADPGSWTFPATGPRSAPE